MKKGFYTKSTYEVNKFFITEEQQKVLDNTEEWCIHNDGDDILIFEDAQTNNELFRTNLHCIKYDTQLNEIEWDGE